jgi:hypothetical protein
MKRFAFLVLLAAGCSSAPVADMMDAVSPGGLPPGVDRYYGGVENQSVMPAPGTVPTYPGTPAITPRTN